MELKLNESQRNAIYKYIKDGYVIIESGRRSGKTLTLCGIIEHWLECQAKNGEYCVVIGKNVSPMLELRNDLFSTILHNDYRYIAFHSHSTCMGIDVYANRRCYIDFCSSLQEYFFNKKYGKYNGVNISLLVGDELYIDPDWCEHTACAYTQYRNVVSLEYDDKMKDNMYKLKDCIGRTQFDREYGKSM